MQTPLKRLMAVAVAACLSFTGMAGATTVTLDFTAPNNADFGSITEDGYTFTDVSGPSLSVSNADILNNAIFDVFFAVGETMSITLNSGGDFTLDSFDFGAQVNNFLTDAFQILGFSDGLQVADYGTFTTTSSGFTTITTGITTAVDALFIIGTDVNQTGVFWDNFVLTEIAAVPLPAGILLLVAAIGTLALLSRRQRG